MYKRQLRTAAPSARIIFRTAGEDSPLTKKLPADILNKFKYDPSQSAPAVAKDRSSIYGGFHIYTLDDEVGAGASTQKTKKAKAA